MQLARQFAARGQQALAHGDPDRAVRDLRTSLSYGPDDTSNRLLLAEALAKSHHPEQARSYFLGLLDSQPADGFINLQLARLARQRNDTRVAIDYYRAAAVGNWSGDSLRDRFSVQLELANFLIQLGEMRSARAELLIASADAPDEAPVYTMLGEKFEQASDPTDALNLYRKAIKLEPSAIEAPYRAGRVAYQMADFSQAARLLSIARRNATQAKVGEDTAREVDSLLENARRIRELTLSPDLSPQDRSEHLLRALPIAKQRFTACAAQLGSQLGSHPAAAQPGPGKPASQPATAPLPPEMQGLAGGWAVADKLSLRRSALQDPAQQENLIKLIFQTEEITARVCGAPSADDALLLQLAKSSPDLH